MPLDVGVDEARDALTEGALRVAGLLRGAGGGDGERPVPGSRWTVGDVGAHLAVSLLGFTGAACGDVSLAAPFLSEGDGFAGRLAPVTAGMLSLETERRPAVLADLIEERVGGFLAATAGRAGGDAVPTPWYGSDATLSLGAATACSPASNSSTATTSPARSGGRGRSTRPPPASSCGRGRG